LVRAVRCCAQLFPLYLVADEVKPRRARPYDELVGDPEFVFRIWRLVGAVEMASWVLSQSEDEKMKELGKRLEDQVSWFFADYQETKVK